MQETVVIVIPGVLLVMVVGQGHRLQIVQGALVEVLCQMVYLSSGLKGKGVSATLMLTNTILQIVRL